MTMDRRLSLLVPTGLAAAALLAACGGGGDSAPTSSVSGSVVKGPVSGASVCAYKLAGTGKGERLQCVTTGAAGSYSMDLPYAGEVVIEATGGTYVDEATGTTKPLSDPMQVVVQAQGGSTVGVVTPLTSVAYSIAARGQGGLSSAAFTTAAAGVASQFQLAGVNLATAAPVVTGTTNAYGQVLRAVSQFIADGQTLATFQAYANPGAFQAAFSSAYATINGGTVTFTLNSGSAGTGGTGGAGGSGGTGATGGSSAQSCGITVNGSGTVAANGGTLPFTLPATKVCVTGIGTAACSAGNAQLQNIASAGATPSGNYSINYNYSYAPGDCTGAVATVAYP